MSDFVEQLRTAASSALLPEEGELTVKGRGEAPSAAAFASLARGPAGSWEREPIRPWTREPSGADSVAMRLPRLPADPAEVAAGSIDGALLDAILDAAPRPKGQGSNNWVVAG